MPLEHYGCYGKCVDTLRAHAKTNALTQFKLTAGKSHRIETHINQLGLAGNVASDHDVYNDSDATTA